MVEDEFIVFGDDKFLYATGKKSNVNRIFKLIMINENEVKIRLVGGDFIRVDNKAYVLKAPNGYYVRVREKDKKLVAKVENPGNRTIFKFKTVE